MTTKLKQQELIEILYKNEMFVPLNQSKKNIMATLNKVVEDTTPWSTDAMAAYQKRWLNIASDITIAERNYKLKKLGL